LDIIDLVLENNNFKFGNNHYLQTEGTAIGSRLGMNYACTYLGEWEKLLLSRAKKIPVVFLRYVDDIWGLWNGSVEELLEFQKLANSVHERTKTVMTYSAHKVNFLDVTVSINDGHLSTDLYIKETDSQLYLQPDSNHPFHTIRSIPYSLCMRIKRICSKKERYEFHKENLRRNLLTRGYEERFINAQFTKVDLLPRESLLQKQTKSVTNRVPMVITFSRCLPNVHNIVRKKLHLLHRSNSMRDIFPVPPLVCFKKDKSLKDILVHVKHNKQIQNGKAGSKSCNKGCKLCPFINVTDQFLSSTGEVFKIGQHINCKSEKVIYSIYCKRCDKTVYVGQTGNSLYQRMLLNFSKIKNQRTDDPVAEHFTSVGHSVNDFSVTPIEVCTGSEIARKIKETFWIQKLRTLTPMGLNTCLYK
jgi:hypothetical protein